MANQFAHTPAGRGPHHLMLGTVTVSRLFGAEETGGQFSLVELTGLPDSGPGAHVDPWAETFYVLEGELTFRYERDGAVHSAVAGQGDSVTIPSGVGHSFSVSGPDTARYLILSTPAGIDAFFADAGAPIGEGSIPDDPPPFDRDKLLAAFEKHQIPPYSFPEERAEASA